MGGRLTFFLATVVLLCFLSGRGIAEEDRLDQLEKRVQHLEQSTKQDVRLEGYAVGGFFILLTGTFCALWARSTGRDPWLWLVAGLLFNLLAVFVALNLPDDQKPQEVAEPNAPTDRPREGSASSQHVKPA